MLPVPNVVLHDGHDRQTALCMLLGMCHFDSGTGIPLQPAACMTSSFSAHCTAAHPHLETYGLPPPHGHDLCQSAHLLHNYNSAS